MRFVSIALFVCLPLLFAGCAESSRPTTPNQPEAPAPGSPVGLEDSAHPTKAPGTDAKDARFSRNLVNTIDKNIPSEWSIQEGAAKNIKWSAKIGTMRTGYVAPAISGGKVFLATNNTVPSDPKVTGKKAVLKCFRESDGQFLWQIVHDPAPPEVAEGAGGSSADDGLLSTPFVDGDKLYYVTPGAEIVCADTDGKVAWRYDMLKELKVFPCYCSSCSPLVVGDRVFVVTGNGADSHDGKVPSPDAPSFAAFDKKSGKLLWSSNLPGKGILEGQWTSPAYTV